MYGFKGPAIILTKTHLFEQQVVVLASLGCLDSVVHLGLEACVVVQCGGDLVQQSDNPPHDTVRRR